MRFVILGPVEMSPDGRPSSSLAQRHRAVLAYLLLHARQVVSVERLIEALWGGAPPETARTQIQIAVSMIRRPLREAGAAGVLLTQPAGYVICPEPDHLDLDRFTGLTAQAGAEEARDLEACTQRLRAALGLWRGPALADVTAAYATGARLRLDEQRLAAFERLADAELALGRHEELAGELAAMVEANPLRERLCRQLMLALYRCGRRPDALRVARDLREALADQQGLDPSPQVADLELAILRGDLALDHTPTRGGGSTTTTTTASAPEPGAAADARPAQLPAAPQDFTGRTAEVEQLNDSLPGHDRAGAGVAVTTIAGAGGVGKTALALHWAHQVRDRFPDGQLYVNLHGYSATPPVRPVDALARFLRALGVASDQIPAEPEEAADMYRTLTCDKRMLILLDNANSPDQVRPLLPGSPGSLALITSRDRLGGLIARDGARPLDLDVLTPDEAVALLTRVIGRSRAALEPDTVAAIAYACGHLPLALRIAAGRMAAKPHWTAGDLAARLADERRRLDELSLGEVQIRASFALSYKGLGPAETTLFRRLSLLKTPEFAPWTAAAVLDGDLDSAQELIENLVDAQLLQVVRRDGGGWTRYRFHDLVRLFARERALDEEPEAERAAVVNRALGCWLTLVEEAHRREYGGDFAVIHGTAARWSLGRRVVDKLLADPLGWLESERPSLVAAVSQASEAGLEEARDLAMTLVVGFCRGHLTEAEATPTEARRLTASIAE